MNCNFLFYPRISDPFAKSLGKSEKSDFRETLLHQKYNPKALFTGKIESKFEESK